MTIDKRALREVAERATKGEWSVQFGDEIYSTDGVENQQIAMVFSINDESDAEFIAAANPATVLALLDELETKEEQRANWFRMAQKLGEDLDTAERLIAELDQRLIEYAGIATREAHRVAEMEVRTVTLPPKEHDNGTDSQIDINAGFANRMWQKCYDAIRAAGIGVKQQQDSVDSDVGSRNQPGMVVAIHIDAGDFVKVKGKVFEVEETDFDDHDVTLWFVGGNVLKCAAGCPVEVVSAPVAAGIKVKGE